jgi:protein-tyrosine phosphatase
MRLLDMAGLRRGRRVPGNARSLVFVCFGNIMRSAMSEAIALRTLRELGRSDIRIQSAGLHAGNGTRAHPWAQAAAEAEGLSLADHRAKLLTPEMVSEADAIVAMDYQNWAELLTQYPDAADRVFMLSAYCDPPWKHRESPDPYYGDEASTRLCCKAIEVSVRRLLATLNE